MDTQELRELTDDGDEVTADRDRAKETLNQVAGLAKQALAENGIDLDLFFLVPNSGESILMFGTSIDPDFATWARVGEIVSAIVREVVGLDDTRCRPVTCSTTTDAVAGNERSPMQIPTPILQNTGAEQ
jgi:hypothetical protein